MIVASQTRTVVVIDSAVKDYQSLANGVVSDAAVLVLDSNRDGVEQICEVLVKFPQVNRLHIVSHGRPGMVQLGSTQLSVATLKKHRHQLQKWKQALGEKAEILLYGCNVAGGDRPTSTQFLQQLNHLTGANIAAAKNPTGNAALGGDWN